MDGQMHRLSMGVGARVLLFVIEGSRNAKPYGRRTEGRLNFGCYATVAGQSESDAAMPRWHQPIEGWGSCLTSAGKL